MSIKKSNSGNKPYPGKPVPNPGLSKAKAEKIHHKVESSIKSKVEIFEADEEYEVRVTIPGLLRENLMVSINKDANLSILLLKDKTDLQGGDQKDAGNAEVFSREIMLPSYVDSAFVSATCHAGTLKVIFKKAAHDVKNKPHEISVY